MSGLCKYSTVFGEPGSGVHKYRVGSLAAIDLFATVGLTFLITRFALGSKDLLDYALVFIILVLAAILHPPRPRHWQSDAAGVLLAPTTATVETDPPSWPQKLPPKLLEH